MDLWICSRTLKTAQHMHILYPEAPLLSLFPGAVVLKVWSLGRSHGISIIWKLVRNTNSQAPPQDLPNKTPVVGPRDLCFNKQPRWFWCCYNSSHTKRYAHNCFYYKNWKQPTYPARGWIKQRIEYVTAPKWNEPKLCSSAGKNLNNTMLSLISKS